jgi:hypothetical protein
MLTRCLFFLVLTLLLAAPAVRAQSTPGSVARSVLATTSSPAGTATAPAPSSLALIENRSRTLGNLPSGSRTQYWMVNDASLAGADAGTVLARLAPPLVTAADHLRKLELLVNLQHPLTLRPPRGQDVKIATAQILGRGVTHLEIDTAVLTSGLTIISR